MKRSVIPLIILIALTTLVPLPALSEWKGLTISFYESGVSFTIEGDYESAIKAFSAVIIKRDPNYTEAYIGRGQVYRLTGKYDLAIADYTRAIELDPKNIEAYYNRGGVYELADKYELAVADFTTAIELYPDQAWAYYCRGLAYSKQLMYDVAIPDYTRAIKLYPKYALAYYNRGLAYRTLNDPENAKMDLKKACDLGNADACAEYENLK